MTLPSRTWLTLKVALTTGLLVYVGIRWIDWPNLSLAARQLQWATLISLIALTLLQRVVHAYEGVLCFSGMGVRLTTWQVARAQWIAGFYGFALPGDVVAGGITWHLLSRDSGGERSAIAAGLVYLRLLNYLMLVPLALLGAAMDSHLSDYRVSAGMATMGLLLALALVPLVSERAFSVLQRLCDWSVGRPGAPGWMKRTKDVVLGAVKRSHSLRANVTVALVGLALVANILAVVVFYLASQAIHLSLPLYVALWMVGLQTLIYAVPFTLAGTGLREVSMIFLLGKLYGVSADNAVLLSIIIFVPVLIVIAGGGGIVALLENFRTGKAGMTR